MAHKQTAASERAESPDSADVVVDGTDEHGQPHKAKLRTLVLGTIGVVYGDIGTSPLYTLKEVFAGHYGVSVDPAGV